ncbi:MAG: aldo/keto reductase [Anaerolineae bacterium]|nr:aldo/keto reductase [Anaerolineae bacterium]
MQYRTFGKLDWKPSALGFGAMRLPVVGDDHSHIDEAEATRMIRYAIDHGVNYIDTAYPYHGGASEPFVGRVLQDGYRERVKLATKMPAWLIKSPDDFDRCLDEQLERLQTHIDFYLLHGLNRERWHNLSNHGVLDWAEKAMAAGRIGRLGFSFHDDVDVFKAIIDAYDNWTFCQIQYNFMDVENQAGVEGLKYAAGKGLAVVIMEPLLGGRLASKPPEPVAKLWAGAARRRSHVDWALQWLWDQPEISLVLSGMSAMPQVEENVESAAHSALHSLTAEDHALIAQVREAYEALAPIPCTKCEYCQPCPNGVSIPRIFETYNQAIMYDSFGPARWFYNNMIKAEERGDMCLQCGECEDLCPQHIAIIEWLAKAHAVLSAEA